MQVDDLADHAQRGHVLAQLLSFRVVFDRAHDLVDQIFYESELAVTFPVGPLFDTTRSEFTAACKIAFLRIFRCFDLNQDGLLGDEELNCLQLQSFGVPLKDEEVAALKQEISKSVRGGMSDESITFTGLMGIMRLFIYR